MDKRKGRDTIAMMMLYERERCTKDTTPPCWQGEKRKVNCINSQIG